MKSKPRPPSKDGYVLVVCLGVVVTTTILILMFLSFTQAIEQAAVKRQYRDRGEEKIENAMIALHYTIKDQFERNAQVEVSTLSTDSGQSNGSIENGMYGFTMDARASGPIIAASETRDDISLLTSPDDPFRGALASTIKLDVTAITTRLGGARSKGNFDFLSLRSTPVLSIRQIPLSEFSLYSSGGSLTLDGVTTPAIGRTYVNGDLNVKRGTVNASYPVAVSGNVNLSGDSSLAARPGPNAEAIALPVKSTTSNEWLSLAKSTQHSTVLTGRDLPMSMVQALSKDELTATPMTMASSSQRDRLRLWRQCSRVIMEESGKITVHGGGPDEQKNYRVYAKRIYNAWGPPVIVFDAKQVAPGIGKTSFYIASTSGTAAVFVRNAATLTSDLTIVTPHPILISGGFNVQEPPHAASLITAQRVFAIP